VKSASYSRWLKCLPGALHKLEADDAIGQCSSRICCCITAATLVASNPSLCQSVICCHSYNLLTATSPSRYLCKWVIMKFGQMLTRILSNEKGKLFGTLYRVAQKTMFHWTKCNFSITNSDFSVNFSGFKGEDFQPGKTVIV